MTNISKKEFRASRVIAASIAGFAGPALTPATGNAAEPASTASLAPGATRTLAANGGPNGSTGR